MKTNVLYILLLLILAVCSCAKKELETEELLKDPAGTISLDISNTKIDNTIYVEDGNFKGALFCPLGEIKGLGHIDKIPKNNWVRTTAVVEGNGYIAWSDGVYYRIFIGKRRGYQIVAKCQYPFDGNIKGIELEKTELSVLHESQKISVSLENKYLFPFKVSSDASWCTVLASSSKNNYPYDEISVVLKKNDDTKPRECIVNITNTEKIVQKFHISQQGAPESVTADNDKITLPGTKSSSDILVNSNSDWDAKSSQSWCHAIKNGNYLTISADENHTGNMRSATISLEIRGNSSVKDYIAVTQQPIDFQLSVSEIEAPGNGYKTSLTVNPKIEAWDVESTAPWCVVKRTGTQILVEIKENITAGPRTARINLFMQGNDAPISYVTVSQKKMGLDLSVEKIEVDGCSSSSTFTVNTELEQDWNVESSEPWCTVTKDGNKCIIHIDENDEGKIRKAKITVKYFELESSVTVVQDIPTIKLSKTEIFCRGGEYQAAIDVESNVDSWSVSSSQVWCKANKEKNRIIISVEENLSGNSREAVVVVRTLDNREYLVTVQQDKPQFSVNKSILQFEGCSSSGIFSVLSDLNAWAVDCMEDWCTINVVGNDVKISVTDNLTGQERTAEVVVFLSDDLYEIVQIRQNKPTFTVVEEIDIKKLGEIIQIPISNVSAWSARCADGWCTLIHNGTSLTISVSENSTQIIRETDVVVTLLDEIKTVSIKQGAYAIGDIYTVYEKTLMGELNEAYKGVVFETDKYGFHGRAYLLESMYNDFFTLYNPVEEPIFSCPEGMMSKNNGLANMKILINMPDFSQERYPNIWNIIYNSDGQEKEFYDVSGKQKLEHRYIPAIDDLHAFLYGNLNDEFGPRAGWTWIRYLSSSMYTTNLHITIDGCVVRDNLSLEISPRVQVVGTGGVIGNSLKRSEEIITFFNF